MESDSVKKEAESSVVNQINPMLLPQWHVIRITYGREYKCALWLKEDLNIDYYLPTKIVRCKRKKDGKLINKEVSVIPNLLFVYATRGQLYSIKHDPRCRYPIRFVMVRTAGGAKEPMTIPLRQMNNFRRVVEMTAKESLLFLDNPEVVVKKGLPIIVAEGPFKGVFGYVLRIRRDRKVVISLDGIIAAVVSIKLNQVRMLTEEEKMERRKVEGLPMDVEQAEEERQPS